MLDNLLAAALALFVLPLLLLLAALLSLLIGVYALPGLCFRRQLKDTAYIKSVEFWYKRLSSMVGKV